MAAAPRLVAITAPDLPMETVRDCLSDLVGSVDAVLLRWPSLSSRELLRHTAALAAISPRPLLSLSDRFDLALSAGVEGVHLRDDGLSPTDVRAAAPDLLIGVSRHTATGVAASEGADYLALGPFARTSSKPGATPMERKDFEQICRDSAIPVLALGGVDAPLVREALRAGASGIACITAIWSYPDPPGAARALRAALDAAGGINGSEAARSGADRPDG